MIRDVMMYWQFNCVEFTICSMTSKINTVKKITRLLTSIIIVRIEQTFFLNSKTF